MFGSSSFFSSFGPVAYILILASIVIIALTIERLIVFYLQPKLPEKEIASIIALLGQGNYLQISAIQSSLPAVFDSWLTVIFSSPREYADQEMSLILGQIRNQLQKPLEWLNLFAIAAPMMGLLGTIWSMSHSFSLLGQSLNNGSMHKMIQYLSEAMYATAFGIILALISMLSLYFLRQKSDRYLDQSELAFNRISLAFAQAKYREGKHDQSTK